jgi:hypothetical protein
VRSLLVSAAFLAFAASPWAAERDALKPSALTTTTDAAPAKTSHTAEGPRVRWAQAPELVVLMSVMRYEVESATEYAATSEILTDAEADELVADLTQGLALLTNNSFSGFAAVHRETLPAGATARVVRSGRIVVGRYKGIRELRQMIGLGGRVPGRDNNISSAVVLLDSDYDRSSAQRRLLRVHELGHALGYDHIDSQPSIMNPRIGTPPTDFDRAMARAAFAAPDQATGTN